ncbi:MAG TPA: MBL fold metallo-hydrolase [Candidatus Binataceae bacterium]|nr:MBL fold metallo-hydrolase [Candidatus Binataceae bacterium]
MVQPPLITIGEFRVAFLSDGLWRNDGGCMFGVVPRPLWQRHHPPDQHNRVRLNLTCPLIMRGRDAILLDCGIGNRLSEVERRIFDHGEGWLLEGLAALGLEAGDITHVVLSHLHFDHVGGVVRRTASGGWSAAFPRARHFIQRGEFEIAREHPNPRLRAAYRHVNECLEPLAARVELLAGSSTIITGLTTSVSGGHTCDHQIVTLCDGGAGLVHLADLVPTRSHLKGPWNQAYDLDPLTTMERKSQWLERVLAQRWWLSFAHDDRVYAAQLARAGGEWQLINTLAVNEAALTEPD